MLLSRSMAAFVIRPPFGYPGINNFNFEILQVFHSLLCPIGHGGYSKTQVNINTLKRSYLTIWLMGRNVWRQLLNHHKQSVFSFSLTQLAP